MTTGDDESSDESIGDVQTSAREHLEQLILKKLVDEGDFGSNVEKFLAVDRESLMKAITDVVNDLIDDIVDPFPRPTVKVTTHPEDSDKFVVTLSGPLEVMEVLTRGGTDAELTPVSPPTRATHKPALDFFREHRRRDELTDIMAIKAERYPMARFNKEAHQLEPKIVTIKVQAKKDDNDLPVFGIYDGGVTGFEWVHYNAFFRDFAVEQGWHACAGTPGSWDRLYIPPDQIRKALDHFEKVGLLPKLDAE